MPHVVLLSASQGKRFSNLTDKKPKCLASIVSVIDRLASKCDKGPMSVDKRPWQEVEYPHDLIATANRLKEFDWNYKCNEPEMKISTTATGGQKR